MGGSSSILPMALESRSAQVSPEGPARRPQGTWHSEQIWLVTGLALPWPATTGLPRCRSLSPLIPCHRPGSVARPHQPSLDLGPPPQAQMSQCSSLGLRVGVIPAGSATLSLSILTVTSRPPLVREGLWGLCCCLSLGPGSHLSRDWAHRLTLSQMPGSDPAVISEPLLPRRGLPRGPGCSCHFPAAKDGMIARLCPPQQSGPQWQEPCSTGIPKA